MNVADLSHLPITELHPHPDNPRIQLRAEVVEQLAAQMQRSGFGDEHAILVRPTDDGYQILSGHHRAEAAKQVGLDVVPCWVKDLDDDEAFMQLVLSNTQGELSPLEIGMHALKAVPLATGGRGRKGGVAEYAKLVGRSSQSITQLRAAADVAQTCKGFTGLVDTSHVALYEISKGARESWPVLVDALVAGGWTVDDTARHVRTIGEFDVPEHHQSWLPLDAVVARYLTSERFDPGRVAKIVRAADSALEWIDANADDLDRQEFASWLARQGPEAWDPKVIDGWLVDLIGRVRERMLTPEIRAGDFRDVLADLPDGSVDLILTDPPYGDAAVPSYHALAEFAAAKLKPGGSLICYTGQSILPDVYAALGEHLRYWWTIKLDHQHGSQQLPGKWVMVEWKPIVWYVRENRAGTDYVADGLRGSRPDKSAHEWAQGIEEVGYLIEQLTQPDHLVVDPFAGSGSFGRMALDLGRRFIGADLDPGSAEGFIVQ